LDKQAVRSAEDNLERPGISTDNFKLWSNKPIAKQTLANLMKHFNQANKTRIRTKTTAQVGYNAVTMIPKKEEDKENKKKEPLHEWKYCWCHGINITHNGNRCQLPHENHIKAATINNPQGGSGAIVFVNNNRHFPYRGRPPVSNPPAVARKEGSLEIAVNLIY
jgi:hypothetical protein